MKGQLTIRGVSEELASRLRGVARSRGESVNTTVVRLLEQSVGIDERLERIARYATWTAEDLADFETRLMEQRRVDEDLWR